MSDLLIKAPVTYELLRKNRFLLRFPSDLGIQEWWPAGDLSGRLAFADR